MSIYNTLEKKEKHKINERLRRKKYPEEYKNTMKKYYKNHLKLCKKRINNYRNKNIKKKWIGYFGECFCLKCLNKGNYRLQEVKNIKTNSIHYDLFVSHRNSGGVKSCYVKKENKKIYENILKLVIYND